VTRIPLWGQGFDPAAELPLGAELYASTGDLVAGGPANHVFNGTVTAATVLIIGSTIPSRDREGAVNGRHCLKGRGLV
jgi:hypothetical protein